MNGDCYEISGKFIMNLSGDKQYKLVHGMVSGQGKLTGLRFGHAWIEYKNQKVIDNSNGKSIEIPKELYYAIGNIKEKECKYYTPKAAIKFMLKYKHFGPWEMSGDPIKLKENIPDKKVGIGKRKIRIPSDILLIAANQLEEYNTIMSKTMKKSELRQIIREAIKEIEKNNDHIYNIITVSVIENGKRIETMAWIDKKDFVKKTNKLNYIETIFTNEKNVESAIKKLSKKYNITGHDIWRTHLMVV